MGKLSGLVKVTTHVAEGVGRKVAEEHDVVVEFEDVFEGERVERLVLIVRLVDVGLVICVVSLENRMSVARAYRHVGALHVRV